MDLRCYATVEETTLTFICSTKLLTGIFASGNRQAEATGERLKALNLPYTKVIHSSMTRAQETARQIHKFVLPQADMKQCDMLREGAPIPPEPPLNHWKPEATVSEIDSKGYMLVVISTWQI